MNNKTISVIKRDLCLFGLLVLALPAQAASFDCAKASTKAEHIICDNLDISKLDEELSNIYNASLKKYPDLDFIKKDQLAWLKGRDRCLTAGSPPACIKASYQGRISDLDPLSVTNKFPVRIEELGANWQYKSDADKMPVIREAMKSGRLIDPPPTLNTEQFCKTFPKDLIEGRNIEVVEPDLKIMVRSDPRLGVRRYTDLGEQGVREVPRDDPKLGHWYHCDGIDPPNSTAPHPTLIFSGFDTQGLLPYYIYRVELDGNTENGLEDVLYYRQAGNGTSSSYIWVDLKGCEEKRVAYVGSPMSPLHPDNKDALSLMIRYQGESMVLKYVDWSKRNDTEKLDEIILLSMTDKTKVCGWGDPFGATWKSYEMKQKAAEAKKR